MADPDSIGGIRAQAEPNGSSQRRRYPHGVSSPTHSDIPFARPRRAALPIVLWAFGFATTMLLIGIGTSLFTGTFCSKVLFDWLVRGARVQRLRVG